MRTSLLAMEFSPASTPATFVANSSESTTGMTAPTTGTALNPSTVIAFTVGCTTAGIAATAAERTDVRADMMKSSICMDSCEKPPGGTWSAGGTVAEADASD